MIDQDQLLLEAVRTGRDRLRAAYLFGVEDAWRRPFRPLPFVALGLVVTALGAGACVGLRMLGGLPW